MRVCVLLQVIAYHHELSGLNNTYFCIVLEARKSQIKVSVDLVSNEGLGCPTSPGRDQRDHHSCVSSYEGSFLMPYLLSKASPKNTITLGIKLLHMNFQSITVCGLKF